MTADPLARPIWSALTNGWSAHAEGDRLALRLQRKLGVFGAAANLSDGALQALAGLVPADGGELWLVERDPPEVPGCTTVRQATLTQMVADAITPGPAPNTAILTLGDGDAAEMLALAELTRPGPYLLHTHRLGRFIGVRDADGRLIAMAGERMRMPGLAEVSAVCTHPDAQGRGLASKLMRVVAERIVARGEQPFLHAYSTNSGAIALYKRLGFEHHGEVGVRVVKRR